MNEKRESWEEEQREGTGRIVVVHPLFMIGDQTKGDRANMCAKSVNITTDRVSRPLREGGHRRNESC